MQVNTKREHTQKETKTQSKGTWNKRMLYPSSSVNTDLLLVLPGRYSGCHTRCLIWDSMSSILLLPLEVEYVCCKSCCVFLKYVWFMLNTTFPSLPQYVKQQHHVVKQPGASWYTHFREYLNNTVIRCLWNYSFRSFWMFKAKHNATRSP